MFCSDEYSLLVVTRKLFLCDLTATNKGSHGSSRVILFMGCVVFFFLYCTVAEPPKCKWRVYAEARTAQEMEFEISAACLSEILG